MIDPAVPSSVLVIMAHPDDAEFFGGGTRVTERFGLGHAEVFHRIELS